MEKIKVIWICEISNPKVRECIHLHNPKTYWKNIIKRVLGKKKLLGYFDRGIWNTLAINEIEKRDNVELHVISSFNGMKRSHEEFIKDDIHYYFVNPVRDAFWNRKHNVSYENSFIHVRRYVNAIIERIQPDIINMIGAENPEYAVCAQDIDTNKYPFVLSMQTALSDPDFQKMYPMSVDEYIIKSTIEQQVFKKARYIAHDSKWYREVASQYNNSAYFTRYYICSKELPQIKKENIDKEFDFVYYALGIDKAAEDAISALGFVHKKYPNITLNIIGRCSESYMLRLKELITELNLQGNITFSGFFEKQEDAIIQTLKSKYALLPIKVDIVSSTIREAMTLGLPVISYKTKGTPSLNRKKKCILLSDIGDYKGLAENMINLYIDDSLAEELKRNAFSFAKEHWNNSKGVQFNIALYSQIIEHFHSKRNIDEEYHQVIY